MDEELKEYPCDTRYKVSKNGLIYKSYKTRSLKLLKPTLTIHGYLTVTLNNNNKRFLASVHRMVLMSWIGLPEEGQECAHKDGIRTHNVLSNLMWCSRSENHSHKYLHGTQQTGEHNPNCKLNDEKVIEIKKELDKKVIGAYLSKKYNISESVISSIKHNKTWKFLLNSQSIAAAALAGEVER